MTQTLVLQLPDNIAQQLQAEAHKQNTTLENFATQCLLQTFELASDTDFAPSPKAPLDSYLAILELFNAIREANQTGVDVIQASNTPISHQLAQLLLQQGLIHSVETTAAQPHDLLTIHLLPPSSDTPKDNLDELLKSPTDDPELKKILQTLQDPDPDIRVQGVHQLGARCLP